MRLMGGTRVPVCWPSLRLMQQTFQHLGHKCVNQIMYIHTHSHPHTSTFILKQCAPKQYQASREPVWQHQPIQGLFLYSSQAFRMHPNWVICLLPPFVITSVRFRVYVCLIYWRICVVDLSNRIFLSMLGLFLYTLLFPLCCLDALVTRMYFQLL